MLEKEYYGAIKGLIINNEVNKSVKNYFINKTDLETKYNIGKLLSEAGKHYGESIIKKYSLQLTNEFGEGYGLSSLKNMRNYYIFQKSHPVVGFLTWSHYLKIMPLKDEKKINYYIEQVKQRKLSKRDLEIQRNTLQCEFCNLFGILVLGEVNLDRFLGKLIEER